MKILSGTVDVIVTRDRNLHYQQNTKKHGIGVVVLRCQFNAVSRLEPLVPAILDAIESVKPGEFIEVSDFS